MKKSKKRTSKSKRYSIKRRKNMYKNRRPRMRYSKKRGPKNRRSTMRRSKIRRRNVGLPNTTITNNMLKDTMLKPTIFGNDNIMFGPRDQDKKTNLTAQQLLHRLVKPKTTEQAQPIQSNSPKTTEQAKPEQKINYLKLWKSRAIKKNTPQQSEKRTKKKTTLIKKFSAQKNDINRFDENAENYYNSIQNKYKILREKDKKTDVNTLINQIEQQNPNLSLQKKEVLNIFRKNKMRKVTRRKKKKEEKAKRKADKKSETDSSNDQSTIAAIPKDAQASPTAKKTRKERYDQIKEKYLAHRRENPKNKVTVDKLVDKIEKDQGEQLSPGHKQIFENFKSDRKKIITKRKDKRKNKSGSKTTRPKNQEAKTTPPKNQAKSASQNANQNTQRNNNARKNNQTGWNITRNGLFKTRKNFYDGLKNLHKTTAKLKNKFNNSAEKYYKENENIIKHAYSLIQNDNKDKQDTAKIVQQNYDNYKQKLATEHDIDIKDVLRSSKIKPHEKKVLFAQKTAVDDHRLKEVNKAVQIMNWFRGNGSNNAKTGKKMGEFITDATRDAVQTANFRNWLKEKKIDYNSASFNDEELQTHIDNYNKAQFPKNENESNEEYYLRVVDQVKEQKYDHRISNKSIYSKKKNNEQEAKTIKHKFKILEDNPEFYKSLQLLNNELEYHMNNYDNSNKSTKTINENKKIIDEKLSLNRNTMTNKSYALTAMEKFDNLDDNLKTAKLERAVKSVHVDVFGTTRDKNSIWSENNMNLIRSASTKPISPINAWGPNSVAQSNALSVAQSESDTESQMVLGPADNETDLEVEEYKDPQSEGPSAHVGPSAPRQSIGPTLDQKTADAERMSRQANHVSIYSQRRSSSK